MNIDKKLASGTYDVTLSGKFTFTDNPEFREILRKIEEHDIRKIVFHISQVEFVDSAALGMLLLAREVASKHQKQIIINGAVGQVKKMLDMANFNTLFIMN